MIAVSLRADWMPTLRRWFHWLSAGIVLLAISLVWLRDYIDDAQLNTTILAYHRQLGLLVLLLWGARLIMRGWHRQTLHAEKLPALLHWAGVASHTVLYSVLLAMPLLGWVMTNASGHVVTVLNIITLPNLVARNPDLADTLQDWHENGAWLLIGLVALHILAAGWHHWIRRDGILRGMLPLIRQRKKS